MYAGFDAGLFLQIRPKRVTLSDTDGELVIHGPGMIRRQSDVDALQQRAISSREQRPFVVPFVEMREERAQNGGLKLIESGVKGQLGADALLVEPAGSPVTTAPPSPGQPRFFVG